jgi:hypothetical protein
VHNVVVISIVRFARVAFGALALSGLAAGSLAAAPTGSTTITPVTITRLSGSCPNQIRVRTVTTQYEGGYTLVVTVIGTALVSRAEIVSATPQRIELRTFTRDPNGTCSGKGSVNVGSASFTFVLTPNGRARFTYRPGTGPNGTQPVLTEAGGPNDLHARVSFTD